MADDEHRDPLALGHLHQRHGAVLNLTDAACRSVQRIVVQGLDGVYDQYIRLLRVHGFQHIAQIRL